MIPFEHLGRRVDPWIHFELDETDALLLDLLRKDWARVLQLAIHTHKSEGKKSSVLRAMLLCLAEDVDVFRHLVDHRRPRSVAVMSRVIFESAVNIMRICIGDDDAAERARRHAAQKLFRSRVRVSEIAGFRMTITDDGIPDVDHIETVRAVLSDFTAKSGREKTSWIDETIEDKIEVIINHCGNESDAFSLQASLLGIFRSSSEVIHGTAFGASYSLGVTNFGGSPEQLYKNRCEWMGIVLFATAQIANLAVRVVAKAFGLESVAGDSLADFGNALEAGVKLGEARGAAKNVQVSGEVMQVGSLRIEKLT